MIRASQPHSDSGWAVGPHTAGQAIHQLSFWKKQETVCGTLGGQRFLKKHLQ